MTLSRRLRPGPLVVFVIAATVAALFAPHAQAFYINNHESITRAALPPDQVDNSAMLQILVGPPPGAGAVGSDAYFSDDFRHIDNAKNPADVCTRAQDAWNFFMPLILGGSVSTGPAGADLTDGPSARAAFGGLAHAMQDFFSHTNWVEDNIAAGQPQRMPPPLMPTCDPATLPAGLHSGYFNIDFGQHEAPLSGCPPSGPPPGFAECHSTLNKDGPSTPRGMTPVPGANPPMNYFDLASQLAGRATTDLFWQVRGAVASANGDCAAENLFNADLHAPCW
jgi:hypothetical protein